MTIGILGGTFDPPHLGHEQMIRIALHSKRVSKVLLVPCREHAFGKNPVSYERRLTMCELIARGMENAQVSDAEREMEHPGRTLELIEVLRRRHPRSAFRLIAGADIYRERNKWYKFEQVEKMAPPLYLGRVGITLEGLETLPAPVGVSSTEVREAISMGCGARDLVPAAVWEYIVANGLYGAS